MKFHRAITFAMGLGLVIGAIAGSSLAVPSRSVYVVIELDQITDANGYEALKSESMQAVVGAQMTDGRYLARTDEISALDGTPPKAIVIIAFESEAKARTFYENEKDTTARRMKVSRSRSFIVNVCSIDGKLSSSC